MTYTTATSHYEDEPGVKETVQASFVSDHARGPSYFLQHLTSANDGEWHAPNMITLGERGFMEAIGVMLGLVVQEDVDGKFLKKIFKRMTREERNALRAALRLGVGNFPPEPTPAPLTEGETKDG